MSMLRTITVNALFTGTVLLMATSAQAQCKAFAKNKCVPELQPYKFNENFNSATLAPGDEAEVSLTFYSGQEYRVAVCVHPILGEVNWKLVDENNRIVFESLADEPQHHFDLKAATTTQLRCVVWVPSRKTAMVHNGCVAIMVGFKE